MKALHYTLRFLAALLFSTLGTSMGIALPQTVTDLAFIQAQTAHFSQADQIGFTARAPPSTARNVAVTGDVTVMHGGAFVTHGAETQWASLNFGADLVATNRGAELPPNKNGYTQADYDAYVARKEAAGERPKPPEEYIARREQLDQNRADGARRHEEYRQEMADIYGEENVLTERYLRDADGNIVKDPDTGEARRLDCVVVNGQCGHAAEVTSLTADKTEQIRKETNIREAGGIYIENPNTGELIEVTNTSEVVRLD